MLNGHTVSIAALQGIDVTELEKKLLASEGPKTQATKADFVKFHDDKVQTTITALTAHIQIFWPSLVSMWWRCHILGEYRIILQNATCQSLTVTQYCLVIRFHPQVSQHKTSHFKVGKDVLIYASVCAVYIHRSLR